MGMLAASVRLLRRLPLQGLLVLGLASYGSWLLFHPAAFLVAAGLLLLDLVTDRS